MFAARQRIPRLWGPSSPICAALRRPVASRLVFSTTARVELEEVTEDTPAADPGARMPLSIQAIYYKPLRRQPTHGLPVCDLQLRSYSVRNLEFMCDFALRAAYYCNLPASGPVPLPKKIERWTVPRSNFVHKKSQENFERITYKRLIQIKDGNPETVELWLAFLRKHQYYGVGMKANVWAFEELGVGKRMNVSLETLRDVQRPKWAHFGPRKTAETAEKVRDILESDQFKHAADNSSAAITETRIEELERSKVEEPLPEAEIEVKEGPAMVQKEPAFSEFATEKAEVLKAAPKPPAESAKTGAMAAEPAAEAAPEVKETVSAPAAPAAEEVKTAEPVAQKTEPEAKGVKEASEPDAEKEVEAVKQVAEARKPEVQKVEPSTVPEVELATYAEKTSEGGDETEQACPREEGVEPGDGKK